jgi:hypothetical protein
MRHEFFDKVLTKKETVDYVIHHLAEANFDPEIPYKRNPKQFINQFVGAKQYNMSKSVKNISIASRKHADGWHPEIRYYTWITGLFIMTLASPSLTKDFGIYHLHFHGYCSLC